MKLIFRISLMAAFLTALFSGSSKAVVTVTPAPNGSCLNTSPGAYLAIGDIVITENSNNDFAVQTNTTLILSAPAGFQFNPGVGSVSYISGRNFTAASITVTATTITVTISVNNTNRSDALTISGIEARATSAGVSGNILRTGGTASISGNNTGGGINHGSLSNIKNTRTSVAAGNWNTAATWSGGIVPGQCDSVVINHTVTANVSSTVSNLTINTGGNLIANNAITVNSTFTINGTGTYTHANTTNASTTIFKGTESFSVSSTLVMNSWYSGTTPLAMYVTGNFGNITFNAGSSVATWHQYGMFAPHRVKGNITISSGRINLDNGTGMTTAITLQDVLVNGTGTIFYATGANRDLNLITGNYTDISSSGSLSAIMYLTYGTLNWQCNGSFTVSHDFSATQGTGSQSSAAIVNITNDLNINGGLFDFNYLINGSLDLTVGGNTNINCGSSAWSHFIESNSQSMNYTTTNLYLNGNCSNNYLQGSTGITVINILNDVISSGTDVFQLTRRSANNSNFQITIGRDLIVNSGTFSLAQSNQATTCYIGRDLIVAGSSATFNGQVYTTATNDLSLTVERHFQFSAGSATINAGRGNTTFTTNGDFIMSGGTFVGSTNGTAGNWGAATFTFNNINYTGGVCYFYNNKITDGRTVTLNVINNASFAMNASSDIVMIIRAPTAINPELNFNVGGNLTFSGHASAQFISSASSGNENIIIEGNMTMQSSKAYFAGNDAGTGSPHNVNMQVKGNLNVNGGQLFLSTLDGTAIVTVNGNASVQGGTLNVKWDTGPATVNIDGQYNQTGGTVNLHSRNAASPNAVIMNVYGDFSQTAGTINYDVRSGNDVANNVINLYGAQVTYGGTGIISHPNHLSNNSVFGYLNYYRNGTITFNRSSSTHDIRHVRQYISSECTFDATTSANNFQISSNVSNVFATHNALTIDGILDLGTNQVFGRSQADYYSAVTVNANGRIRLAHTGGLYSGNATPSAINSMISGNNRMDFSLSPASIIEYNGTDNQIITGIPNGIATGNQHKYGVLDINFQGTPDVEFVFPESAGEVFIRSGLQLTAGELNLDSDYDPINGGRYITIENGANIARTSGYIRSEIYDGSGEVVWNITGLGSFAIPFGYSSSAFIPFTVTTTSGSAGDVRVATYHTDALNTPYPSGVIHVNDQTGNDNSAYTVDRFWRIQIAGTPTVDYEFTATAAEVGTIASPVAQRWTASNNGWEAPQGVQSNPTAYSTLASGITGLNTWWTLSAGSSPLPVEMAFFKSGCENNKVKLRWGTASEKNNAGFEIQRSTNGNDFETIGTVKGKGNTTEYSEYNFSDPSPSVQTQFYRLKQCDFNGTCTLTNTIIAVPCNKEAPLQIISSAIADGLLLINIASETEAEITIKVFDVQAKLICQKNVMVQSGMNQVKLCPDSGSSVYLFSVSENQNHFTASSFKIPVRQ